MGRHFDIYETIVLYNVHLGDDNVVKAIRTNSILVEMMVKEKNKKDSHQRCLLCVQVASEFALDDQTFVEWVESALSGLR